MRLPVLGELWPLAAAGAAMALLLLRRPLGALLRLLLRSAAGLGFLLLWGQTGLLANLALGANWFNALTLGVLGLPGLGLLFMLRWLALV